MKWKTLASEYINKHIFFTARKDRCEREDGTIVDPYYVVELPDSATALAITEEGQVVLIKQYRHPIDEVIFETPGGFIDSGEEGSMAMRRELMEETGYDFEKIVHVGRAAGNAGLANNFTEFFLATGGRKTGQQKLDHNEEIEIVLVGLDQLKDMLLRQEFKQALHVSCIWFALMQMGELEFTQRREDVAR